MHKFAFYEKISFSLFFSFLAEMALAHDDELQALLQQMRSDPVATGIKKHGPVNPQVKKHKGTSGGESKICAIYVWLALVFVRECVRNSPNLLTLDRTAFLQATSKLGSASTATAAELGNHSPLALLQLKY